VLNEQGEGKEWSFPRRRIRNVCVRLGFPLHRRLGLEHAVKY
jgi:hypothetical protein